MVKVVQLQNSTKSAGSSAIRLHDAFLQAGIDSTILSLQEDKISDDRMIYLNKKHRLTARIDTELKHLQNRNSNKSLGSFTYPVFGTDVTHIPAVRAADVIYVHWVLGGFMSFKSFEKLFELNKPIVIVMHDMWWITGGCHYSFSCEKYYTECHRCPVLNSKKDNDLSTKGFRKKRHLFTNRNNLYFVSPSKWLRDCAKKSALLRDKPVSYIPNAIDQRIFKPFDQLVARTILNISEDQKVIAFGAVKLNSPFKGWPYLQHALDILSLEKNKDDYTVIVFGSGFHAEVAKLIPFKTKFLGYLDEISLNVAYNAADVFVVPSMADNQPTVIMESLCCGTPVAGFDVGGIPDMIEHKQNGYLATYKDAQDLARGIDYCIEKRLKGFPLPQFDKDRIIEAHKELIASTKTNTINSH